MCLRKVLNVREKSPWNDIYKRVKEDTLNYKFGPYSIMVVLDKIQKQILLVF